MGRRLLIGGETIPMPGETTLDEFLCIMNTLSAAPVRGDGDETATVYSDRQLYFLYHGMLKDELLVDNHDGLTYVHTVYLTKDTNHIRIMLQDLDNDGIEVPDEFDITITDADGVMTYDNSLVVRNYELS